ncbi:MAG: hypothetical protein J6Q22_10720 [Prevotella sp.]|nr:hypothetical protein [Prevotella sp.]
MNDKDKQVKSIVLLEGHVRWIMERETPEERLAAWETLAAIAFPENPYELPYKPPQKPLDGSCLSPCDRVRRDTYNMLADYINGRVWENNDRDVNKEGCVGEDGLGIESSSGSVIDDEWWKNESAVEASDNRISFPSSHEVNVRPNVTMTPLDMRAEETMFFSERYLRVESRLTEQDKKKIEEWHKKIPNAKALRRWLDRNWYFQNKKLVCSEKFCEYAYNKLAREDNWVSYKTNHAMSNISTAIHWIAIDFQRKENEIKRAEEEERRKDQEVEFDTKVMLASHRTSEDLADMQRISSRKAEREAMEKILRGEL